MSVDNSEALLLLMGNNHIVKESTIGIAGDQGFGVGIYGGDPTDLTAMGLTPMNGYNNPASKNYGNYIHVNGSIMVFVPAFCYRIGRTTAPSYSRDKENALEIRDATLGEGDGWILHRAFIDGGKKKSGFFIDKYLCSKDSTGNLAISVRNRDQINLGTSYEKSSTMPDCSGKVSDAITLGRARGEHYSCTTCFQWAALSMLSLAHGQAATSNKFCAWYDGSYSKNFPKGCNDGLADTYEPSLTWSAHSKYKSMGKTGSCITLAKSTHNGQDCGIADIGGCMLQVLIGCAITGSTYMQYVWTMKNDYAAHSITTSTVNSENAYDKYSYQGGSTYTFKWGTSAFYSSTTGKSWVTCGVLPYQNSASSTPLFGKDECSLSGGGSSVYNAWAICAAGGSGSVTYKGYRAGVWLRTNNYASYDSSGFVGFRAAGYAK